MLKVIIELDETKILVDGKYALYDIPAANNRLEL